MQPPLYGRLVLARATLPALTLALLLLLCAGSAQAHFPTSIDGTLPPGGNLTVTTPSIPATADEIDASVTARDAKEFKRMVLFLAAQPTPGAKVVVCLYLHLFASLTWDSVQGRIATDETASSLALVNFVACLRIAQLVGQIQAQQGGTARATAAAASPCINRPTTVPATITKTGSGYRVQIAGGSATRSTKQAKLRVTCKLKGTKLEFRVRARKKGRKLRRVVGDKLKLGIDSIAAAGSGSGTPLTIAFRIP